MEIPEYPAKVVQDGWNTRIEWEFKQREEIVRCRDCKHYRPQGTYHFSDGAISRDTCKVIRGFVVQINPNGFCAWGERRE